MAEKVAVVHDWLNGMRGGEKVLEEILALYPRADIFTLFYEKEKVSDRINAHPVFVSRLNRFRFIRRRYQHFLPLLPAHVEDFDLQAYDLVISSSHCVAKGAIPSPRARHVSYIHSPMRYAWDQYHAYFSGTRGLKKVFIRRAISRLRTWDVASASRVDLFLANSEHVRRRVKRYYGRDARVVHPPVDTDFFQPGERPSRDFYLLVSALVPYKNIPLIVEAFNRLGERLVIVGSGAERARLQRLAGKRVELRGFLAGEELRRLYQDARALVFGGVEDFGIFFVEALACGTPVVALGLGGVRDIVEDGRHGVLFQERTEDAVISAVERAAALSFDPQLLRERALQFSIPAFRRKFAACVEEGGS